MTIKGSVALFLSPSGHLIHVPQNHISTVIADAERFGLTREEIEAAYLRHGERVGVEGEARKELLLRIIAHGWIRIRRYPNRHWSATTHLLEPDVLERLRNWADQMLSGIDGFKEQDRYMPVKVSTSEGESFCTIRDLAEGSFSP
ncbi:MAG: hypothetical protein WBG50_26595 [Desulfomonilaceae bacterium]